MDLSLSLPDGQLNAFDAQLADRKIPFLRRGPVTTVQINIGKYCNQACHHCHVDAGPSRTERMQADTADLIGHLLARSPGVGTVDITGGAPELNPAFRDLVREARRLDKAVIDRCNLTVLFTEGQENLADFLAANQVVITASLPCYTRENVDAQRGHGVFERSIEALRLLNRLGYGLPGSSLILNLVYNPLGGFLPGSQDALERDYRRQLGDKFDVQFTGLQTLINMPISRFAEHLHKRGEYSKYMSLLVNHFNERTLGGLMCRRLISIGWDGFVYDCDFNQMLGLGLGDKGCLHISHLQSTEELEGLPILTDRHCFGCTAGPGSSCGGALVG